MLNDCLFESRPDHRQKKPISLAISLIVHVAMFSALLILPLMHIQAMSPIAPPPPLRSASPQLRVIKLASAPSANRTERGTTAPQQSAVLMEPASIPKAVAFIEDGLVDSVDSVDSFDTSLRRGLISGPDSVGIPGVEGPPRIAAAAPPPPLPQPVAPPEPKITIRQPIRVSSAVQAAHLLKQVDPVYPRLAVLAAVEGAVVVEARITESGTIEGMRVISGNPLLIPSVFNAVKQWRYEPTMLNGIPMEVITTITVNFTLRR